MYCENCLVEIDDDPLFITGDGWNDERYELCSWNCVAVVAMGRYVYQREKKYEQYIGVSRLFE